MAKRKAEPPPEEEVSQEVPEQDESEDTHEPESDAVSEKPRSQADMIRACLAAGIEGPSEGVQWIKREFDFDMERTTFSATKAQIKNREGRANGEAPRPRASHAAPTLQTTTAGIPQGFGGDVRSIKELIEEAGGAEQLRELTGKIGMLTQKYGVSGLNELISAFE